LCHFIPFYQLFNFRTSKEEKIKAAKMIFDNYLKLVEFKTLFNV